MNQDVLLLEWYRSDNDLENVEGQSKCHAMEYTEADLILAIERT